MKLFGKFFEALFAAPTIEDVIEHEMRSHAQKIQQCEAVIKAHQFQKHMSKANIAALEEWNHQDAK